MRKIMTFSAVAIGLLHVGITHAAKDAQPNILWVLTDDQRFDSIAAFNKMITGKEESELGYVESPNVDRLAEMGTTFINTYCHAQGCAPSRSSMHLGRYPFRSGVYGFQYYNNNAEHSKPTLPEQMAKLGYQTAHQGKLGVRLKTVKNGKAQWHKIYQSNIRHHEMWYEGLSDWGKLPFNKIDGIKLDKPIKTVRYFVTPEGKYEYASLELERQLPQYKGTAEKIMKKYDHLRRYEPGKPMPVDKNLLLGGVSSQTADKTRDAWYERAMERFLDNENKKFSVGSQTADGVNPDKPLFLHLGFDFPHTPVLPPKEYRERFAKIKYKVPNFDKSELKTMAKQLRKAATHRDTDHMTDKEKQIMIQDYYAFCAYGDSLVGKAADAFIKYSEKHNQPWRIVYVCGDHGWKLNEHGAVCKFTPWKIDSHNPIIVVSSDKKKFPAGKVVRNFAEFVDIAPTCLAIGGANLKDNKYDYLDGQNLADIASGKNPARDYVIGETSAVIGPRAYIRTKEYVFSMRTRPHNKSGKDIEWARSASYKDLDPSLYHMTKDPNEVNNVAFSPEYQAIAQKMKEKLINIVIGDNRVEVDWGKKATGTKIYRSNFAPGADDKKLKL